MTGAEEILLILFPLYNASQMRTDRRKRGKIAAPLPDQNRSRPGEFEELCSAFRHILVRNHDFSSRINAGARRKVAEQRPGNRRRCDDAQAAQAPPDKTSPAAVALHTSSGRCDAVKCIPVVSYCKRLPGAKCSRQPPILSGSAGFLPLRHRALSTLCPAAAVGKGARYRLRHVSGSILSARFRPYRIHLVFPDSLPWPVLP